MMMRRRFLMRRVHAIHVMVLVNVLLDTLVHARIRAQHHGRHHSPDGKQYGKCQQ